jgi:hypothetical protein
VNAVEQLSERSPWVHPWCTEENACRPVSPHSPPRPFRQRLDARGLKWAVGIPKQKKVYPSNVELVFPVAGRGRPRRRPVPHQLSAPAEAVLAKAKWRSVSWRKETKGPLASLFRRQAGAERRWVATAHPRQVQHMPGEEAWLVGERRASGEHKYYQPAYHQPLRTGPPATQGRTGPTTSKAAHGLIVTP